MTKESDGKKKNPGLRVDMKPLPPRQERTADEDLEYILKRVAGQDGAVCKRDCDCAFGLVCTDGKCRSDW